MQMMSLEKEAEMETKTAQQRSLDYRNAMARLGAAVNIVTTDGAAGRAGFAATAVCSVSDNPPTLLICLNRNSSAYRVVKANGVVCVNTLAAHHEVLSTLFGGKTPAEERFAARIKLAEMPRNSSPVRIRNRCELTGRARGYYRKLRMCRNQLRDLASQGLIPGMTKSSW